LSAAPRRPGLSLLEVLVALMIVALLAAALFPTAAARLRQGQATALATQMDALRRAILDYENDVGRHPRALAQLTNPLVAGTQDACGGNVPAAVRSRWRGPYLTQNVTGDVIVGDAMVRDTTVRQPPTTAGGQDGQLRITALGVDSTIAAILERQYDGAPNFGSGTILWAPTTAPLGTMIFQFPIRGC